MFNDIELLHKQLISLVQFIKDSSIGIREDNLIFLNDMINDLRNNLKKVTEDKEELIELQKRRSRL